MRIPNSYNVGGQKVDVRKVERCDNNCAGVSCVAGGWVEIAEIFDKDEKQSESSKINTFYHELTHTILATMGEHELNNNEKFVCTFSSFLCEALESVKYENE